MIFKHDFFRIHCFNKYGKNKNDDCPDLELTYYIECSKKIEQENLDLRPSRMRRKIDVPIICQHESIKAPMPENITTDLKEDEITTEPSNTLDSWTSPQEDTAFETLESTTKWTEEITEMTNEIEYVYIYVG